MVDVTVLAVTGDSKWLRFLWTGLRTVQGTRLVATGSLEEATGLLDCAGAGLIVIDWNDVAMSAEHIDDLLWTNSTLPRPAAVLVVDESYRPDQALALFQLGVDEYVGLAEHQENFLDVLGAWLDRTPAATIPAAALVQASRSAAESSPQPQRWVATAHSA